MTEINFIVHKTDRRTELTSNEISITASWAKKKKKRPLQVGRGETLHDISKTTVATRKPTDICSMFLVLPFVCVERYTLSRYGFWLIIISLSTAASQEDEKWTRLTVSNCYCWQFHRKIPLNIHFPLDTAVRLKESDFWFNLVYEYCMNTISKSHFDVAAHFTVFQWGLKMKCSLTKWHLK